MAPTASTPARTSAGGRRSGSEYGTPSPTGSMSAYAGTSPCQGLCGASSHEMPARVRGELAGKRREGGRNCELLFQFQMVLPALEVAGKREHFSSKCPKFFHLFFKFQNLQMQHLLKVLKNISRLWLGAFAFPSLTIQRLSAPIQFLSLFAPDVLLLFKKCWRELWAPVSIIFGAQVLDRAMFILF